MASLDKLEGDAIELVLLVVLILAIWLYIKSKGAAAAGVDLWKWILKFLDALQAKLNVLFNGTIQRIETANLAGTNTPGDLYGPGQFDVITGISSASADQWAQYPLSGVNDGSN